MKCRNLALGAAELAVIFTWGGTGFGYQTDVSPRGSNEILLGGIQKMKALNKATMVLLVSALALSISACSKKKTSSNGSATPAASAPVAAQCYKQWDGSYRDEYNRTCSPTGTTGQCSNVRYDLSTGQYYDLSTNQVVNCTNAGYYDGMNSLPYNGSYGNQQFNGCQSWSYYYNAQYVPIDMGNGQMVCMNTQYLQQNNPNVNWNNYNNYNQNPYYSCQSWNCYQPAYQNGYQYSCQTSINLGYFSSAWGGSLGLCF